MIKPKFESRRSSDQKVCTHDAAYYNARHDNFYCIHCKKGMGEAFYIVAKENMKLEREIAALRKAIK